MTAGPGDHPAIRVADPAAGLVEALHRWAEEIRREELSRAEGRWEALSEDDRRRLDALTRSIVGAVLGEPTARLRAGTDALGSARYLFGLDAA